MRLPIVIFLLGAFALTLGSESALAKKVSPKRGTWIDLQTKGLLFGTIAEVSQEKERKESVTYYIRKKDGDDKPEKLESVKGLFAHSLESGWYEIYDWTISGKKYESQNRYVFEVKVGHLTYIGRIVTNVYDGETERGSNRPRNLPYVSDERSYDATLFANIYPVLAHLKIILAVRHNFAWR